MSNESILGKRSFDKAFGQESYDDLRYDNHIDTDYFQKGGLGHGVYNKIEQKTPEQNLFLNLKIERKDKGKDKDK
jgi:hypothetical protein